jgi:poly-beta-1,6-N-acetyl-D-glucosamine biosynthesis protein PgaD
MEESGTQGTAMTVTREPNESPLLTTAEVIVTVLFWGLWLYLVMPLVSLILWLAGVYIFVDQMVVLGGYQSFIDMLYRYSMAVVLMMVTIFLWVWWNASRYGSLRNKRILQPAVVTNAELAAAAATTEEVIAILQSRKHLVVDFDDEKRLILKN